MNNYENNILDAIEIVVENTLNNSKYDKTIIATVEKQEDLTIGKYIVKYQNVSLYAYSSNLENFFSVGDSVYVLVPNGDMSQIKTIIDKVDKDKKAESVENISTVNRHYLIGSNIITNESQEFGLSSYIKEETKVLYSKFEAINLLNIDEDSATKYLKENEKMMLGFSIKTDLEREQQMKGNYGIICELAFEDEKTQKNTIKTYTIDINNLSGSVYAFKSYTDQMLYFNINNNNFKYINKISIFEKDFPNEKLGSPDDLFFSNFKIYAASEFQEDALSGYALTISTPDGTFFKQNDPIDLVKTFYPEIRFKGEIVKTLSNVQYYWFKENPDITLQSLKYNQYGGQGWQCLNLYTVISENIVNWETDMSSLNVVKQQLNAIENKYKCVVVLGEQVLTQQFSISNEAALYNLSIVSDEGEEFYFDQGYPTLTCLINGESIIDSDFSYSWAELDYQNYYTKLNDTTAENKDYLNTLNAYNLLLQQIENEVVFYEQVKDQLKGYEEKLKDYEQIQRVDKNQLIKLSVNQIVNYSTFKCSVYYRENYLGAASIVIKNNKENLNYKLEIKNGNKIYKYNENGTSPVFLAQSNNTPIEIEPLSFVIYDPRGREVSSEIIQREDICWTLPEKDTLLTFKSPIDVKAKEIPYSILSRYDFSKTNNTIELSVDFKGIKLTDRTTIFCIKEGENGTNGTEYSCRIVPNQTDSTNVNIPILKNGNLNYTPAQPGKWFKAQFFKDGECIFDGYQVEAGSQINKITWEVLKNKYSSNYFDLSTIQIENEIFSLSSYGADGYFHSSVSGYNAPADLVKCTILFQDKEYYAIIPIITIKTSEKYDINFKENSGFLNVLYDSAGNNPKYAKNPFELEVFEDINGKMEDISELIGIHRVDYEWNVRGNIYDFTENTIDPSNGKLINGKGAWVNSISLADVSQYYSNLKRNQVMVEPSDTYSGECVSNGLECILTNTSGQEIGKIHIPIYLYLNRYGITAINGWDGNSIQMDDEGGYILSPQMGAGSKDSSNRFTGILMGTVKEPNAIESKQGVIGYHHGEQSFFLDADSGGAVFGKNTGGRIVIDPKSNKGLLFSQNYWKPSNYDEKGFPKSYDDDAKSNQGLLIDLAKPSIEYGNGKFSVDEEGNVVCGTMLNSNGVLSVIRSGGNKLLVGYSVYTDDRIVPGDYGDVAIPAQYNYLPQPAVTTLYVPKNFTIKQAKCILTTDPSTSPDSMANSYFSTSQTPTSDYWTWSADVNAKHTHCTPYDYLSIYVAGEDAVQSIAGGFGESDIFFSNSYLDISNCELLKDGETHFTNLNQVSKYRGNISGKTETYSIDITNELKRYLLNNPDKESINLAIAPTPYSSTFTANDNAPITFTYKKNSSTISGYVVTPDFYTLQTKIEAKTGTVIVDFILYGYYK